MLLINNEVGQLVARVRGTSIIFEADKLPEGWTVAEIDG